MSEKRAHTHMLYLPTELYVGLIKKMAELEIGKSAAILDCVNNSLFNEGFIDGEAHEEFLAKYRRRLVDVVNRPQKVREQRKTEREIKIETNLTALFKEWDELKAETKEYVVKRAKEYPDFPISKLILKKAEAEF